MGRNKILHNKQTERQPSLDLLRFIAAMMVATMHWGIEVGSERYQGIYGVPIISDLYGKTNPKILKRAISKILLKTLIWSSYRPHCVTGLNNKLIKPSNYAKLCLFTPI